MSPYTRPHALVAILAYQSGTEFRSETYLFVLGALLIACALCFAAFLPPTVREKWNEFLDFEWPPFKLHIPFLEFVFLGGLALIGASIYVSEPARLVAASASQLKDLNKERTALQGRLDEAQRQIEKLTKVNVLLNLTLPGGIDLNNLNLESIKCYYVFSDGGERLVPVTGGNGPQDVKCLIENMPPEAAVVTIKIEQELQGRGPAKKYSVLAYRNNIYPAQPNYSLCLYDPRNPSAHGGDC